MKIMQDNILDISSKKVSFFMALEIKKRGKCFDE